MMCFQTQIKEVFMIKEVQKLLNKVVLVVEDMEVFTIFLIYYPEMLDKSQAELENNEQKMSVFH